jgi:protein-S-isoprenylcysteine O-methyltransferase Ste14
MSNLVKKIFKYRSYTPIPFLLVMIIFQQATILSIMIGFAIVVLGELFRLWGVVYAGSETRTTGKMDGTFLVISGAFAHLRNPLYLGNILIYSGIGIMSMALFPYLQIGALVFFYFQYLFIILEEEKYLLDRYRNEYELYKSNVPRFIPRFTPFKEKNIKQPPLNVGAGLQSEKRTVQAIIAVIATILIQFFLKLH